MARRHKKKPSPLQKTFTIVGLMLCIVLSFMLICNITIIVKGTINPEMPPSVLGVTPMVTLSSSMDGNLEDSFAAGDLIFSAKTDPAELKVGDVISYMEGSIIVTHRVIEVQTAEDGSIQWITKGDANNTADINPVVEARLVGKYLTHIPGLGNLALFMQKPLGMILFVGVPLLGFIIYDIIRRQNYSNKVRRKTADMQAEIDRLRALTKKDAGK